MKEHLMLKYVVKRLTVIDQIYLTLVLIGGLKLCFLWGGLILSNFLLLMKTIENVNCLIFFAW